MKSGFQLIVDQKFKFTADWDAADCPVVTIEPNRTLAYSWAAYDLESVAT